MNNLSTMYLLGSRKVQARPMVCLLFVVLSATAACHTMRFDVTESQPPAKVVYDRKHYFLWGLVPTVEVDVREHCPNGVSAVREQTTCTDGIADLFTLGIWSPRSSWYHCLPAAEKEAAR